MTKLTLTIETEDLDLLRRVSAAIREGGPPIRAEKPAVREVRNDQGELIGKVKNASDQEGPRTRPPRFSGAEAEPTGAHTVAIEPAPSVFDQEPLAAPPETVKTDINGVPFDPKFVSGGASPLKKDGTWKKKVNFPEDEFNAWYAANRPPLDVSTIRTAADWVKAVSEAVKTSDTPDKLNFAFTEAFTTREIQAALLSDDDDVIAEALQHAYLSVMGV